MWMEYLNQDVSAFHREDYYLAQIAALICKTNAKHPEKIQLKDFILKFGEEDKEVKKKTLEEATEASKRQWGFLLAASKKRKK